MLRKSICATAVAFFLTSPAFAQQTCEDGFQFNPDAMVCEEITDTGPDEGTIPQLLRFLTPDDQTSFETGTEVAPTGRSTLSLAQNLPLDLTVILDRSSSMAEPTGLTNPDTGQPLSRFDLVREAFNGLLNILPAAAEISLVYFGTDARALTTKTGLTFSNGSPVNSSERSVFSTTLDNISPQGSTRLRSALSFNRQLANFSALSGLYLPDDYDRETLFLSDGAPTDNPTLNDLFSFTASGDLTSIALPGTEQAGLDFLETVSNFTGGQTLDFSLDPQGFLDAFLGNNLLLSGLSGVDITNPDGNVYSADLDALGHFVLEPFALAQGENIFTAQASFLDGTTATETLSLFGTGSGPGTGTGGGVVIDTPAPVPLPATGWMLIIALTGGAAAARKRTT